MLFSKRLTASRVLFVILPFVICVSIGVVAGFHGGLHNEATTAYYSSDWSRAIARHNELRLYGAFVLLTTLSVSALVTLALFVGGIFRRGGSLEVCEYRRSTAHHIEAVIRVYDDAGNVIETHEHKGDFKEPREFAFSLRLPEPWLSL